MMQTPLINLISQPENTWKASNGNSSETSQFLFMKQQEMAKEKQPCSPTPSEVSIIDLSHPERTPELTIVEQSAQHYRFRYQSEIERNRIGGLLLGRNSDENSKSFIKLQISGIDPTVHSQLHLIACTVSSDKGAHPYYLHGENCHDGYFEIIKYIDKKSTSVWDIKFDKLAVICVPKKNESDVTKAMEARAAKVPKLHDMKDVSDLSGDPLFHSIRLAFSLNFTDKNGFSWVLPTVYSDEITDLKEKKKTELNIECLNPEEVPLGVSSIIAIYTKTPTTGLQKTDLKVLFTFITSESEESADDGEKTTIEQDVIEVKKHLLITKTPVLVRENERTKCEVRVRCNQFLTKEKLNLLFLGVQQPSGYKAHGVAMKRAAVD